MSASWENRRHYSYYREVLRPAVFARDGWQCQIRLRGVCTGAAEHVHHTRGKAVTGDDMRYMVAACKACNLKVGEPSTAKDPQPRPVTRW